VCKKEREWRAVYSKDLKSMYSAHLVYIYIYIYKDLKSIYLRLEILKSIYKGSQVNERERERAREKRESGGQYIQRISSQYTQVNILGQYTRISRS